MSTGEADLQIAFFFRLKEIKKKYLQEALFDTVGKIDISVLDSELGRFVSKSVLSKIAQFGLRGEVFIPVPVLFDTNPKLLGYYRLLYGVSQKEFSKKHAAFQIFEKATSKRMPTSEEAIALAEMLIPIGESLVNGIDELSGSIAHELQLLTLGPQLRGGRNTDLGKLATERTFTLIRALIEKLIVEESDRHMKIRNAVGNLVTIKFSSDPDIAIVEELKTGERKLLSIEIKGGTDFSNAHNRLGEAEKSHLKARKNGYFEFWTIVRVDLDESVAKKESPTTSRFFNLDTIADPASPESDQFRAILSSTLSIVN